MKNLVEAHDQMSKEQQEYIEVNTGDHSVRFTIQDGPIKKVGVNGVQATDMLLYCKELFASLNEVYPCGEDHITINAINVALDAQKLRTKNRESRGVEGESKA